MVLQIYTARRAYYVYSPDAFYATWTDYSTTFVAKHPVISTRPVQLQPIDRYIITQFFRIQQTYGQRKRESYRYLFNLFSGLQAGVA